jgi:hypothetical protein
LKPLQLSSFVAAPKPSSGSAPVGPAGGANRGSGGILPAYPDFRNSRPKIAQVIDFWWWRPPRSAPQGDRSCRPESIIRGNSGGRLGGRAQLQLLEQDRLIHFGFGVA